MTLPVRTQDDLVIARREVRRWCERIKFSTIDQTKVVTAASELARNMLIYGGGGELHFAELQDGLKTALRLVFDDQGPGIADVTQAMVDGYTTGNGMGLGLSGAKRLVNEFDLVTAPGAGTRITIVQWKRLSTSRL
ncbi:anti-sigma regulatory factor [Chitinasiproducens palmae]|nr:anti-sigma regulatory factor [Chitinasiproducens palmae]